MFCFSVRSGSKQLATIINFLLSIAATFAFGFIASQYAFPTLATVCNTDVCMTTVFLNYFSLILTNYSYFQLLLSLVCLPGMVFRLILFTLTLFQFCLLKYTTQRVTPPPAPSDIMRSEVRCLQTLITILITMHYSKSFPCIALHILTAHDLLRH